MFLTVISNSNFWYFSVLNWVLVLLHHIWKMIRLFNLKRKKTWPIKPYRFAKYSLRIFQWYVAWRRNWAASKAIYLRCLSRNTFNCQYLHNHNCYKSEKIFFQSYIKREIQWYMSLNTILKINFSHF